MTPAAELFSAYHEAQNLLAAGELRKAADICKVMLDSDPDFPYGYHLMSSLFRATGTYEKALNFAQLAIRLEPSVADFHIQQGQILLAIGAAGQAVTAFETAHTLEPDNFKPLMLWADACAQQEEFTAALKLFARARACGDASEIDEYEGMCRVMQGDAAAAEILFNRVIEHDPLHPRGYILKGKMFTDIRRDATAEACFARALKLQPECYDALHGMALLNERQGQPEVAIRYAMNAIQTSPRGWDSHALLGALLLRQGHHAVAEQVLQPAYTVAGDVRILQLLVEALQGQGKTTEALAQIEGLLALQPDNAVLRHFHAILSKRSPDAAPREFISGIFDGQAERYDYCMAQLLSYQLPALLADSIEQVLPVQDKLSLLDIGCGTGLAAEALRHKTNLRIGVDVSAKMLALARGKQLYKELHQWDMVEFMCASNRRFDLVIAADVLIYSGKVTNFLQSARNVLSQHGVLAVSVEKESADHIVKSSGFRLDATGRYTHAVEYMLHMAREEGYKLLMQQDTVLRMQHYLPVQGELLLFRKEQIH